MKKYRLLILACAVIATTLVYSAGIRAGEPTDYSFKTGSFTVYSVLDTEMELSADLLKNGDKTEIAKLLPEGKQKVPVNVFVIKTGKDVILVDAGVGPESPMKSNLIANLERIGVSPSDVSMILVTHAHFDHIGGLVSGGKAVFKKARIYYTKAEESSFDDKAIASMDKSIRQYFEPANRMMKVYAGKIEYVTDGGVIREGIKAVSLAGHTVGQTGYMIESGNDKLFIVGDIIHMTKVQFARPQYSLMYDSDAVKAAETRIAAFTMLSSGKTLCAGSHIPFREKWKRICI